MRRFLATNVSKNSIYISGEEANHMRNAVRMSIGDEFIAIDGSGIDYTCAITNIDKDVKADILSKSQNKAEPEINVTLYQAYPKSAKMNEIVQKAVELGAAAIVPFLSKRCVKRPSGQGDKLSKVALSAVKQCGRSIIPNVTDVQSFEQALELMSNHELLIICDEEERQRQLYTALQVGASDIGIVIGSEGGFERSEIERVKDCGGIPVTLGRRIMRTETAGIAVLAACFYAKGEMEY
ncbi:MAG: 16S rRNA (uracil(1498)-N(3))-methyltransferase [Clostridia bacterium]|jgi:16S rRNA (uracil1498-N3)-methyltransferase|nr:16S rRNA (uracil(1498)-N(3))-methyltransferase [Clostridia bacterium]MBT7121770.1 16S rRNA (uracil(1498)-N(3))-methyltransferase [Clostridia bacterium]